MEDNVMALRQENTGSGAAEPLGGASNEDPRHGTILPPPARRYGPGVTAGSMSRFDEGQRVSFDGAGVRRDPDASAMLNRLDVFSPGGSDAGSPRRGVQ